MSSVMRGSVVWGSGRVSRQVLSLPAATFVGSSRGVAEGAGPGPFDKLRDLAVARARWLSLSKPPGGRGSPGPFDKLRDLRSREPGG